MSTDTSVDPLRLMTAFWHVRMAMVERFGRRVEAETGITAKDFFALMGVQNGLAYPSDIATSMMLPTYAVSRILEGLTNAGLLERHLDSGDARRIRLSITKKGEKTLEAAQKVWRAEVSTLFHQLPLEHQEQLVRHMETLAQLSREPQ